MPAAEEIGGFIIPAESNRHNLICIVLTVQMHILQFLEGSNQLYYILKVWQ